MPLVCYGMTEMNKFFTAAVAVFFFMATTGGHASGQPLHQGDIIYACPVSGGNAIPLRSRRYSGEVPVFHGRSGAVTYASIASGRLAFYSAGNFRGKTWYYDRSLRVYKVAVVGRTGHPRFTDEFYTGVIPCVNGTPPTHGQA